MNLSEWMQTYFGDEGAGRLGEAAGLGAGEARRALREGLPLQIRALAAQARTPGGAAQIGEAVQNLPPFPSVEAALAEENGAAHLAQAGELLAPALLGAGGTTGEAGAERLLQMALPLTLSFLGQRGLREDNAARFLADMVGEADVAPPAPGGDVSRVVVAAAPGAVTNTPEPTPVAGGPLTSAGLLDLLRGPFGPPVAEQLGRAAGFSGNAAARATGAALPVLLGAVTRRGSAEAGAADLLTRSRDLDRLLDPQGGVNPALLADPAETARLEGQGRGLLGTLFGNVDAVTGRLGSAIGGSGANAGRLLALLAPLVLALIGRRARAENLGAAGLAPLLGGLGGQLPSLLPAGLSGLAPLLTAEPVIAAAPAPRAPAPPPAPVTTTETTRRRRGLPWWLLPLLLLLALGGCYLLQNRTAPTPAASGTTRPAGGVTVTTPASGATVPAADLTLTGTAPAGETVTVEEGGAPVTTATADQDGQWQATVPAPAAGEHTYAVRGLGGAAPAEVRVNVSGAASGTGAGTDTAGGETSGGSGTEGTSGRPAAGSATGGTSAGAPAGFSIAEPAPGAQLPAGGFTLRGTATPGQSLQVLEDGTSLGNVTVGEDGTWSLAVPSPAAGARTYAVQGEGGTELGRLSVTVVGAGQAAAGPCDREFTVSIRGGQTVDQPFRFGGEGRGGGYRVTVRRGERVIGTRDLRLDATCGWSYQSSPGAGRVTYEVRPLGDPAAEPLSTVDLTVRP